MKKFNNSKPQISHFKTINSKSGKTLIKIMKAIHKLSGQTLEIIKINDYVAVCKIEKPYRIYNNIIIDKIVCKVENLEIDNKY